MTASDRESLSRRANSSAISITGKVDVGRFVLDVGGAAGSIASRVPQGSATVPGALERAAKRDERDGRLRKWSTAGTFEHDVERTSEATDAIERATELFKTLAEGRIDPKALSGAIDELLSVTGHFVKAGRIAEAIKLGHAVCGLLALAQRWAELVHTLRQLLSAAETSGDAHATAWASHELGTLHLCAENPREAGGLLRQARETRENLGDGLGIAATDHNLRALCRLLQDLVSERRLVQPRQMMRRSLLVVLTLAILLAGGGSAAALLSGGGRDSGSMIASSPSSTTVTSSPSTTSTTSTTSSSSSKGTTSPPPAGPLTVSFISGAPSNGIVRQVYPPFVFTAKGDSGIRYSVTGGGVPGLSLSPDGELSGTPIGSGTFTLNVRAQGASGAHADQSETITIAPPDHSNRPAATGSNPPAGNGTNPPAGTGTNPPTGSGPNPPAGSGTTQPAAAGSTPPGLVH